MSKIKITEKEIKLDGKVEPGRVTPFGTASAHIPFKKEHTGKIVSVVVPTNTKYTWLISQTDRNLLLSIARKNIQDADGKLEHYRLQLINDLEKEEFNLDSLIKILNFVPNIRIVSKIKSLYNIK